MANEIHIGQSHSIYRAGVHRTKADPNRGHGNLPGFADGDGVGTKDDFCEFYPFCNQCQEFGIIEASIGRERKL